MAIMDLYALQEMMVPTASSLNQNLIHTKLQWDHSKSTNSHLFSGGMPFLLPEQHCQSTEEKICQIRL